MAWSYSGNPGDSDLDAVRYLVGDTNINDQLVTDEEIEWALAEEPNVRLAAAITADAIAAKLQSQASRKRQVGRLRIETDSRIEAFKDLAERLREQEAGALIPASPYAGGTKISEKVDAELDTDRQPPYFSRGMMDEAGSAPDDVSRV